MRDDVHEITSGDSYPTGRWVVACESAGGGWESADVTDPDGGWAVANSPRGLYFGGARTYATRRQASRAALRCYGPGRRTGLSAPPAARSRP